MPEKCPGCKTGKITSRRVWNENGKVETCFELYPCMGVGGVTVERIEYCIKKFSKKERKRKGQLGLFLEGEPVTDGGTGRENLGDKSRGL